MTRPNSKPLLWAFWLSAMVVSCGVSGIVFAVFRAKGTFLGTTPGHHVEDGQPHETMNLDDTVDEVRASEGHPLRQIRSFCVTVHRPDQRNRPRTLSAPPPGRVFGPCRQMEPAVRVAVHEEDGRTVDQR